MCQQPHRRPRPPGQQSPQDRRRTYRARFFASARCRPPERRRSGRRAHLTRADWPVVDDQVGGRGSGDDRLCHRVGLVLGGRVGGADLDLGRRARIAAGLLRDVGQLVGHELDVSFALARAQEHVGTVGEGPRAHRGAGLAREWLPMNPSAREVDTQNSLDRRPNRRINRPPGVAVLDRHSRSVVGRDRVSRDAGVAPGRQRSSQLGTVAACHAGAHTSCTEPRVLRLRWRGPRVALVVSGHARRGRSVACDLHLPFDWTSSAYPACRQIPHAVAFRFSEPGYRRP